jgi:ABC-type spermidine/putrescine transport system permease subunit II
MILVVLASAGLALLLASGFSFLASSGGFLFSGISTLFVALVAVAVCAVVTSVTALVLRRRQRRFGWRTLFMEVAVSAFGGLLNLRGQFRRLSLPRNP